MTNAYQEKVALKYNIFNSLFLSLPFRDIFRTGTLLPLLTEASARGFAESKSPQQIIENFFQTFAENANESERLNLLFALIKYIERQVVLFDAVEDAAFDETHELNGKGSIRQLLARTEQADLRAKLLEKLPEFSVRIVLTAHPTQFYPGKVLGIINELEKAIKANNFPEINSLLLQLGKTGFINQTKPTPFDEAVSLLWYVENVFYETLPQIIIKLLRGLHLPVHDFPNPTLFQLGFWSGGDRDGNPFVTSEVTLRVAEKLRHTVLQCYRRDARHLRRRLTFRGVEEIIAEIELKLNNALYFPHETHYTAASELVGDLYAARTILREKHDGLFLEKLDELILKVRVFGFFLASLDIRQVSRQHEAAWAQILVKYDKLNTYNGLTDESEKIEFLLTENFTVAPEDFADEITRDIMASMQAIREIQARNGEAGCHRYIISNCASALNMIEVLALARNIWQSENIKFDILPLFETVEDLAAANEIMRRLYENPVYRGHLANRGNKKTIMVGFSDGTKDGGYLRANWSIFRAKEALTAISREFGIKVVFFDGRGGPPGRGGGNNADFYASLGAEIEDKEIQLTVQGQTISSNYGTILTASYTLERLFTAGLENSLSPAKEYLSVADKDLLEELANISFAKYSQLKNDALFTPYLEHRTPLKFYGKTNIGSRPDKRNQTGGIRFEDLRAIPFVGAWAQMKQNVPGFYGFGAAIEKLSEAGRGEDLQNLYRHSLFFRTLVENSMQSLSKSFFPATAYLREDVEFSALWEKIFDEFCRTKKVLLRLSGAENLLSENPVSQSSIHLRENIVLPLITIQQFALQKLNAEPLPEFAGLYEKLVMRSMFGIINAARNSA